MITLQAYSFIFLTVSFTAPLQTGEGQSFSEAKYQNNTRNICHFDIFYYLAGDPEKIQDKKWT